MIVFNTTRNIAVVSRAVKADSFRTRLFGLIPRRTMEQEEGLWLAPCAMIHSCFMSFPIDAVFLDAGLKVMKVVPFLKPWRFSPWVYGAAGVLELAPGRAGSVLAEGELLEFR
ncbi:MAG: DUF192 domain-containing protein [Elusimicrobiales bacterium]|jgi:hypothetical protein